MTMGPEGSILQCDVCLCLAFYDIYQSKLLEHCKVKNKYIFQHLIRCLSFVLLYNSSRILQYNDFKAVNFKRRVIKVYMHTLILLLTVYIC